MRRARPVGIDTVAGDADGRDVGEEIVQQDLLGQQRQERQEERRHSHADHVAEVGAGSQVDVLERVGEGAPAFIDALADQRQLVAQQHEVGGLLGHIHRGVHGDADIRGVQRRRVVDPVAEKAHHMTGLLQRADDALLLVGIDLGEQADAWRQVDQRLVAHLPQFAAGDDALDRDADALGDLLRDQAVVAADDLHRHAQLAQCVQFFAHARLGRIEEQQETGEGQALLVIGAAVRLLEPAVGDTQHAVAGCAPGGEALAERCAQRCAQRQHGIALLHGLRHLQNGFQRALADQPRRGLPGFAHQHAQALAREVIGHLVQLVGTGRRLW
ncbi:hypothetical protein SSTU70S_00265 [Stutzerimonas stutzeri]